MLKTQSQYQVTWGKYVSRYIYKEKKTEFIAANISST